ncbi:acyl-CoA synthetase [Paracoccus homiensis]|uniref:Acyl-CoA synthetase (AMP-forming)/AMP-acid ligase II n=1 Tax=Paracoccus homiensis TaxID=364199 RepID=A0A1I0HDU2_9RHOB|nr:acyl-CoA synthetase [Paracoccus homiensis]SET82004.1 Acyl-CoA synthetase (AMP-forming)/AMP-acid ligase II [Paracoccus homiensis]
MSMPPVSDRVMNLCHFLTLNARRLPDAPALIHGDATTSWSQMQARVGALAHALIHDYQVAKGDRILVQSANCLQMFETMFACWRAGAIWVPANFRMSPSEIAWLAQSSGARVMFCGAEFDAHASACAEFVEFVIPIGASPRGADHDALIARHMGQNPSEAAVARDDPAWFFYTSGTTGRPKAAVLTHGQLAFVITNHLCDLMPGTTEVDASLVVAPLSHGAGIHQLTQVARGVPTILPAGDRFDPAQIWALVEKYRVTNMFTVPTIVKLLVEDASVDHFDHTSLRYVIYAGAPMYRADQIRALNKLGPVLVQYFGLGEVTGNITVLPPAHHSVDDAAMRIGTCGLTRTGMQVQVQDAQGEELPAGQTGEIAVIGPAVFAGYHDNPQANAKSFRNGWFLTGDLGHMDEQGFLYLTGRESDMYISGGSNIYPREIEEKLLTHPDLAEVIVLGAPDPVWGETGLAVCVARAGRDPDPKAVLAWLAPHIARYKLPKRLLIWDALPKSAYGKITRKMIRQALIERGEWPDATAKAG